MSMMIRVPYVIDNERHRMADVLGDLLSGHSEKSLDIATAYFNVRGFTLLQQGLQGLGSFRLLLGDEPGDGEALGLRPRAARQLTSELSVARGTLKKCVNSQAVYPLSEQDGLEAQERR